MGHILLAVAAALAVLVAWHLMTSNSTRTVAGPTMLRVAAVAENTPTPPPPEPQPDPVERIESVALDDVTSGPATADAGPVTDPTIGLDEPGGAGSDAFGLAGKPGGRELLLTRDAGGVGASSAALMLFASQLECHLEDELNKLAELRRQNYSVGLSVWVAEDGAIRNVRIDRGSGDAGLDRDIKTAVARLPPMATSPPRDVPQPIRLRIVTRGANCGPPSAG